MIMTETPQEYTKRILGNVEGQNPLKVQAGTAKKRIFHAVNTLPLQIATKPRIEEVLVSPTREFTKP